VLDDQDRDPGLADGTDDRHGLLDLRRVQPRHDLVEQQDARLGRQGPRELEPLA